MDPPLSASQIQKNKVQYKEGNAKRYKENEQRQIKADKQQCIERQAERNKHVRTYVESRSFIKHLLNRSWPDRHQDLLRRRIDKSHQGLAKYKMRKVSRKEEYAMNLSSNINDMDDDDLEKGGVHDSSGALDDDRSNDMLRDEEDEPDEEAVQTTEDTLSSSYSDDDGNNDEDEPSNESDDGYSNYSSDFSQLSDFEGGAGADDLEEEEDNVGDDANSTITGVTQQVNLYNNGAHPQLQQFYDLIPQERTRILSEVYKKLRLNAS